MSQTVSGALSALRSTAELLGTTGGELSAADPGPAAFGAGGPGRLGELGRELYLHWQRTLDARGREATAHASRLQELADLAGRAAGGFREAEENAHRGQPEVS
jgi:hypothetical protein